LNKIFKHYKASYSGLPKAVWILSFVILINRSGTMVLFFMTLYLTQKLGYNIETAGKAISIYGLGSLAGAYLGGWLSDKWGPSRVQLISLISSAFGFIILGYLETYLSIIIFLFFVAICNESFRPANITAVGQVSNPENRARSFGLNRLAINLGITIGPAVGGILASLNYLYLFWVDGITCFFAAIILFYFIKKYKIELGKHKEEIIEAVVSPWKDKTFLVILGLLLFIGMVFFQLFNTWPIYLKEIYTISEGEIGTLFAINGILIVLIEMPLIHLLEKKDILKVISIGTLFIFVGFSMLPLGISFLFVAFSVVVWTIGEILIFPYVSAFISNRATNLNRGKYMGLFTLTFSLAMVIGPAFGSWIYNRFSPATLWFSIGLLGIFIFLSFLTLSVLYKRKLSL
jgi:predicted MFS family arabinose efflux permease